MAFEDETTITQKPCIHKSMSFEGQQQRIEHNGSRKKFSTYISMLWPDQKLMYDFYDRMNSTNTIDHLENLKRNIMKNDWWKRLILIWDNASYHVSLMVRNYINAQKEEEDWLTIIHLPKKAPYLNPNERKVNQQIKSDVCGNRFYEHIEEQKTAVSEYLNKTFGIWYDDIKYDT
jgi:DDE superfamily endonuclease